jgi:CheY-like chemotaxis protein
MSHILVVEDDADTMYSMCDVLVSEGYESSAVPSGEAALQYLSRNPVPCLVLLDLMMPGIGGHEVVRKLKSNPAFASIPLVIVSGADNADMPGLPPSLKKPVDVDQLLAVVSAHCPHRTKVRAI